MGGSGQPALDLALGSSIGPALGAAWNSSAVMVLIERFFIRTAPPVSGTSLAKASTSSGESASRSGFRSTSQMTTTFPCLMALKPVGEPSLKRLKSLKLLGAFLFALV